jgi:hypothetical protein
VFLAERFIKQRQKLNKIVHNELGILLTNEIEKGPAYADPFDFITQQKTIRYRLVPGFSFLAA